MHRRSFFRFTTLGLLGAATTAAAAQHTAGRSAAAGGAAAGTQASGAGTAAPLVKMYKSPT
jgi:putative effector of murein hydrolase